MTDVRLDDYDAFLFDLDGVLHVGDAVVPGAPDAIRRLREAGSEVRFVTNNSRSTRESIAGHLRDLGIAADPGEIVTSCWAAATALGERGVETAYVIGTEGFRTELRRHGVEPVEAGAAVVAVGLDPTVTYDDLATASRLVYHDGADLVAANADGAYPTDGGIAPGAGAITSAIEAATGATVTAFGKPEPRMFERALGDVPPDRALMVGDNPSSDIGGAARAGIDGVLVTGDVPAAEGADGIEPVATVDDVASLFDDLG